MALARAWMLVDGLLAVFCVLCISVHGQSTTAGTNKSSTIPKTTKTDLPVTLTPTTSATNSSSVKPTSNTTASSMTVTVPTTPSNYSTTPSSPGNHSSTPPTKPRSHSSPVPTTNVNNSVTATPKGHVKDLGGSGSSSGKWVATGFAVFFGLIAIVMTVLYCRQRKIYRELEGDSSLSRLI